MEHARFSGEHWSDYEKQRLFVDMQSYLVNYGMREAHVDDDTGLPTGLEVRSVEATSALNQVRARANDPEVADESYLSYTPAHKDVHNQHHNETLYLLIHSVLGQSRQQINHDYRISHAAGEITGTHTIDALAPEDASQAERLYFATTSGPQDMRTGDFEFLRNVLQELRYQRGITL